MKLYSKFVGPLVPQFEAWPVEDKVPLPQLTCKALFPLPFLTMQRHVILTLLSQVADGQIVRQRP